MSKSTRVCFGERLGYYRIMGKRVNNKYYELASNSLLFFAGSFVSKILVFFLVPLYTYVLTTDEYGVSEILVTGTSLIIPFVSLSIQDATLRFALDRKNNKGEVIKNSIFVLLCGTVVLVLLTPIIKLYQPISEWAGYFAIISFFCMVRNVFSLYTKGIGKTKLFAIDSIIYTALLMVLGIVFLTAFRWGLRGYFVARILAQFASVLFLFTFGGLFRDIRNSKVNLSLLKDMICFSAPMILNNVSWWVLNSSDRIMVERIMSVGDAGLYSASAKMPALIVAITSIFNQAWVISSVSEYDSTRDGAFFSSIFGVFHTVIMVFSAVIIIMLKPFMKVYVGPEFAASWKYVPMLLLGSAFQSYALFFGAIYTSAKKNLTVMLTTLVAAIINFVLNFLLIPRIGIQGAALATAVAYLIVFVYRMIDSQQYVKFDVQYARVTLSILLLTAQCVATIANWNVIIVNIVSLIGVIIININSLQRIILFIHGRRLLRNNTPQ